MNQERLDEIRVREDAAYKGPWVQYEVPLPGVAPTVGEQNPTAWPVNSSGGEGRCVFRHRAPWRMDPGNRDFILHARTDIPDLLDEVERLREKCLLTKDGVPVQVGDWVYADTVARAGRVRIGCDLFGDEPVFYVPISMVDEDGGWRDMRPDECYSTEAAALAARAESQCTTDPTSTSATSP